MMSILDGVVEQAGRDKRHELASALRGQNIHLPDLYSILEGWPEATSSHLMALRAVVVQTLDEYEQQKHFGALPSSFR